MDMLPLSGLFAFVFSSLWPCSEPTIFMPPATVSFLLICINTSGSTMTEILWSHSWADIRLELVAVPYSLSISFA